MEDLFKHVQTAAPGIRLAVSLTIIIIGALVLSGILKRLINRLRDAMHLTAVMAKRIHTFRRWMFWILAILLILEELGAFNSAWSVITAGLAAFSVGFVAAWSMLSNATAALLIITFRPFRLGDSVEIMDADGKSLGGRVVDMNLMYTSLLVEGNSEVHEPDKYLRIPNNLFFQKVMRICSMHEHESDASFFDSKNQP